MKKAIFKYFYAQDDVAELIRLFDEESALLPETQESFCARYDLEAFNILTCRAESPMPSGDWFFTSAGDWIPDEDTKSGQEILQRIDEMRRAASPQARFREHFDIAPGSCPSFLGDDLVTYKTVGDKTIIAVEKNEKNRYAIGRLLSLGAVEALPQDLGRLQNLLAQAPAGQENAAAPVVKAGEEDAFPEALYRRRTVAPLQ